MEHPVWADHKACAERAMELRGRGRSRRLLRAAAADGISYIAGLSGLPFPLETLKTAIGIIRELSPLSFVDWKLKNWPEVYHEDRRSLVRLPYRGSDFLLPQVLGLDNTNAKYRLSDVVLSVERSPFRLRPDIHSLTDPSFRKLARILKYSNNENLRLVDITERPNKVEFKLQRVRYEDYLRTNLVLDARGGGKRETLRQYLHAGGALEELRESPLANNLGVNILGLTSGGSVIVQKRSRKVAFRRGELCPLGSGTLSVGDVQRDTTLNGVRVLREAFDEVGIRTEDISPGSTLLLGVTRELIRGGEPEMFLTALINLAESEVISRWKHACEQWEAKKLIFYSFGRAALRPLDSPNLVHEFLGGVDGFIDKFIDNSSIPLLTNLALWVRSRLYRA